MTTSCTAAESQSGKGQLRCFRDSVRASNKWNTLYHTSCFLTDRSRKASTPPAQGVIVGQKGTYTHTHSVKKKIIGPIFKRNQKRLGHL